VQRRHEVDFIIEVGRHCIAREIKSVAQWQKRDLSGQGSHFAYNGKEAVKLGEMFVDCPGLI
jgi:hypothetical protein